MKLFVVAFILCAAFVCISTQEKLDEDEFVLPIKKVDQKTVVSTPEPEQSIEEIKKIVASSTQKEIVPSNSYLLEIVFISLLLLYGSTYFIGKRKNETIANDWMQVAKETLESNFSICRPLEKESNHIFKVFAAGRINCSALQATITLKKRYDLFSLLTDFIWPTYDQLKIEVAMDENVMDSFVFGICNKKEAKKFKSKTDIEKMTKQREHPQLSDNLIIFSEFEDIVRDLLTPEVCGIIGKQEKEIISIHISDQDVISPKIKKSIQLVFKLSSSIENSSNFLKLSIYFIDLVSRTQLSKLEKQKAEKARKKKEEEIAKETLAQRQEAAQQRKLEKLQKQKAYIESLSPEQQRKMEEKLHKHEMKKKLSKAKQMVVRA